MWAESFLQQLYKAQVYIKCCNTDYEGEIKGYGDTVRINTLGLPTISDYTPNSFSSLLVPEVLTGAGESLTINQAKMFNFAVDDVDKAQAKGTIMSQAMKNAAYKMRDVTDIHLATVIAAQVATANILLNGGAVTSTSNPLILGTGGAANDAFETLVNLGTQLNLANVPPNDRWVVVDPNFAGLLLKDPRFTSFATAGALTTMKQGATLGGSSGDSADGYGGLADTLKMLVGFDLYVSNNVPVSGSGATAIFTILAGYTGAVTYAQQLDANSPEAYRYQGGFADAMKGLHLFGSKVTRPDGLAEVFVQYA